MLSFLQRFFKDEIVPTGAVSIQPITVSTAPTIYGLGSQALPIYFTGGVTTDVLLGPQIGFSGPDPVLNYGPPQVPIIEGGGAPKIRSNNAPKGNGGIC